MTQAETTIRVHIRGRVQGVGFRYSLQHVAEQQGVSGWCRNLPDGSIEALLHGAHSSVDAVVTWCNEGPPLARVDEVDTKVVEDEDIWPGFRIRS